MDLARIKEIKSWLDDGVITQEIFKDLKTRYINGEDFALIELDALVPEQEGFTEENYDKFTNTKTICTIRQEKFGGWLDSHKANQSIMLNKNEMKMPSLSIDHENQLFATAVYSTSPNGESIYIELLNYCRDGYADKGADKNNFSKTKLEIVVDSQNINITSVVIKDDVTEYAREGLINKVIFDRNQLLKFEFTKEDFTVFCDGKEVLIRTCGIELKQDKSDELQAICKQLYNDTIEQKRYKFAPALKVEQKTGCFIATAAMGSYDDPLVLDLRFFRDNWLTERSWGESFITNYYNYSPKYASIIDKNKFLKLLSYIFIVKPLHLISKLLDGNK